MGKTDDLEVWTNQISNYLSKKYKIKKDTVLGIITNWEDKKENLLNKNKIINMNSKPTRKQKIEMDKRIQTAEKGKDIYTSWQQHMLDRDEIESFTTIVADKLYNIRAKEGETLMPFSEYHGDHSENWIILLENKTNREILRKNTKTVDMINWKLSSPSNNLKKDEK